MLQKGEIYWVPVLDENNQTREIIHPQVIIQDTHINNSRIPTVVVCGISTNMKKANEPGNILLDPGEGGLPKRSIVVVSEISLALKESFGTCIGTLSPERVAQIFVGMKFVQSFQKNR